MLKIVELQRIFHDFFTSNFFFQNAAIFSKINNLKNGYVFL